MKHYFITNRPVKKENEIEEIIFDNRTSASEILRFGETDDKLKKFILYPDIEDENQLNYKKIDSKSAKGSVSFFKNIYDKMSKKETDQNYDLLCFIHGFSNDEKSTLKILKNLEQLYIEPRESPGEQAVIYSWPTNGSYLEYRDDKRDAEVSGFTLARGFLKLQRFFTDFFGQKENEPCNNKIHLICHSMGNYVLESMMRMLISSGKPLPRLFNEVILVGSDLDCSAFEPEFPLFHLTDICERVHIYYHKNDFACQISEHTKNAFNRLGKHGPKNIITNPNVMVVDVTGVISKGLKDLMIHHWYHFTSEKVIKDIYHVLNGTRADLFPDREYIPSRREFRLKE